LPMDLPVYSCGRQLRSTLFCQFFSVAIGSTLRRDNSNVCFWHTADMSLCAANVCF